MLGMLHHDLQQDLPEILQKRPNVNQDFENSTNNIESTNAEPYFEEFDEEFSQISIEETNMELIDENELAINNFFNANIFEQNQNQMEIIEENLANNSQRSTNCVED
ncbi:40644_t:CDS:1 [Gigaspora margarita]|uniref:40644_t:CDS:1 n=1 Tax=Gigaspora margarita TaxID=4874 RepID=A0ABN7VTM9_GIGMA|nr:40644_t:CDS:1 [Gigaspora margarita]